MVRHHMEDDIGKRWDKNSKRRPADRISRWKDKHADDVGNAPAAGYVLAARCFQFDRNSMESVDCEEMAEDDSVFRKYDYVVLVRLAVDG